MRILGATFFASALALVAGCSSGSSESPRVDEAARNAASLRAPDPIRPELDPCASVRCAAGTECVVVGGHAECAENDINPCAAVLCAQGTTCEVVDGEASCTPIEPSGPECGGFAGLACPGAGSCVDDPTDDCDPAGGGADCGGNCVCPVLGSCVEGFVFDESPAVCACVEAPVLDACARVRCAAGTECVVEDGNASCQPNASACAAVSCIVGSTCEVVDGEATCVPNEPPSGPFCGGIANIQCPGSGTCGDNTADGCSPENGGADCGGVCECNVRALCIRGFAFDASPDVCACVAVPELDPCAAVRCASGTECVVVDGGATCAPVESPCNLVDCMPNDVCEVQAGEAVCVPAPTNPCAAVLCERGSVCVVDGDEARCQPAHDCD